MPGLREVPFLDLCGILGWTPRRQRSFPRRRRARRFHQRMAYCGFRRCIAHRSRMPSLWETRSGRQRTTPCADTSWRIAGERFSTRQIPVPEDQADGQRFGVRRFHKDRKHAVVPRSCHSRAIPSVSVYGIGLCKTERVACHKERIGRELSNDHVPEKWARKWKEGEAG